MLQLNTITPLVKKRKRIGRGGSRGGTCGKGHKGQKARTGGKSKVRTVFEGGQTPLSRRLPKRGFNNAVFSKEYQVINIEALDAYFDAGAVIDREVLFGAGLVRSAAAKVKVLGRGELTKSFTITVDAFSEAARQAIEKKGGKALLREEAK